MSSWATSGWIAGATWIVLQPVPTIATRLPARSTSWSPAGGVEARAREVVEPGDRRDRRHRELAAGGEQDVGLVRAGARLERSSARGPRRSARRVTSVLSADAVERRPSSARRPPRRPGSRRRASSAATSPGSARTRTRRGARARRSAMPGIGVVVPDAADALAALEDRHVVVARAAQHAPRRRSRRSRRRRSRRSAVRSPSRAQVPGCRSSRCSSDGSYQPQAAIATRPSSAAGRA